MNASPRPPRRNTTDRAQSSAAATTAVSITEVVLPGVVEPAGLQVRTRPMPTPGPRQVLVAVEASGVSMAEQAMRRNRYPGQP